MSAAESEDETEHPLAPFYRAWGYRTWSRLGTLWIASGGFSVVSVPCSHQVATTRTVVEGFLRETGRIAAQFSSAGVTGVERNSYWVRDRSYGLASLQRQFRQHVLHERGRCVVRPITWPELAAHGYDVLRDALIRQAGSGLMAPETWAECCRIAGGIPHLTATGCFVDGELATFLVSWLWQRHSYVLMYHRSRRFDEFRPSHKLITDFTVRTIRRDDVDAVTLGRDLVPAQGAVGDFKRHAGYRPEPIPIAAILDPRWHALLVHRWTRGAFGHLRHVVGHRAGPLGNVEVLDVAAKTRLPPR